MYQPRKQEHLRNTSFNKSNYPSQTFIDIENEGKYSKIQKGNQEIKKIHYKLYEQEKLQHQLFKKSLQEQIQLKKEEVRKFKQQKQLLNKKSLNQKFFEYQIKVHKRKQSQSQINNQYKQNILQEKHINAQQIRNQRQANYLQIEENKQKNILQNINKRIKSRFQSVEDDQSDIQEIKEKKITDLKKNYQYRQVKFPSLTKYNKFYSQEMLENYTITEVSDRPTQFTQPVYIYNIQRTQQTNS